MSLGFSSTAPQTRVGSLRNSQLSWRWGNVDGFIVDGMPKTISLHPCITCNIVKKPFASMWGVCKAPSAEMMQKLNEMWRGAFPSTGCTRCLPLAFLRSIIWAEKARPSSATSLCILYQHWLKKWAYGSHQTCIFHRHNVSCMMMVSKGHSDTDLRMSG